MNTLTAPQTKSVSLYYREGSSDKEYHATIEAKANGFVVNFAYGRRGSTLSTGTKTTTPVEYEAAVKIFDRLVAEKKAKGYTEGSTGTPYQQTDRANAVSGLLPQLLNPIEESEVPTFLQDRQWVMQEKKDGRRLLLRKSNGVIEGINKKGLVVSVADTVIKTARELPGDFVLDGEAIGNLLYVFDLLFLEGRDVRSQTYEWRYVALLNLMASGLPKHIKLLEFTLKPADKATRLEALKRQKAEGVVFKQINAPYTTGRPNSGGTQFKYKFVATLSAVVAQVNQQRSVQLRLLDHQGWHGVGNVTIPPNHKIPGVGAVVEVRYLYAYPDGSLFQPVYLGVREDVTQEECVRSQLKFKASEEDEL